MGAVAAITTPPASASIDTTRTGPGPARSVSRPPTIEATEAPAYRAEAIAPTPACDSPSDRWMSGALAENATDTKLAAASTPSESAILRAIGRRWTGSPRAPRRPLVRSSRGGGTPGLGFGASTPFCG